MATRLYFQYGVVPSLAPAYDPAWEKTGSYRYTCSPVKQGTAFTEINTYESSSSVNYDAAIAQFISDPLAAQTINGTIKGQILARESAAAADLALAIVVRVVSALGVPRGTLLSYFPDPIGTAELSAGAAVNRYIPVSIAISELAVQAGDRLVIEIGFRAFNAVTTTYYTYLTVGDAGATDLPEDEAEVTYLNPWIEFSGSLVWISETALAASGSMRISGTSVLGSSTISEDATELVADTTSPGATCMVIAGESAINSVLPTQFLAEGYIGISAPGAIDSVLPTITALAAAGAFSLSAPSSLESVLPTSLVTALAAYGSMILSSKCQIGDETDLGASWTDFIAAGGYRLSGIGSLGVVAPANLVTALAAAGGFAFGGSGALDSPAITVHEFAGTISYLLGGTPAAGVIYPSVTALVACGGYILGSPGELPGVFEAWVLSGQAFEPSIFSAFSFNSFAQRGAQTFAAGEEGIFLLGGDDDDGEVFHTGARIGPVNFGADRDKRMRGIQLGNCGADTKVRVATEDKEGVFTPDRDTNRVVVSRDIQGREFTIDLMDFQELSQFEATVLMLARR